MPRRPRFHLDEVPLHVVQRGHNRGRCFFAERDYAIYLHWLGEAMIEADCALHAYALMTNHVHLLLTPRKAANVPRLMMSLGRRYVQHVNRNYGRSGTLWDSRYRSSLIQTETYLLACQRYIEANPVRAAMVRDPAHYRWSSYHAHALGRVDRRLTPHPLYLALGRTESERRAAYRALFDERADSPSIGDIRQALRQNQPLGDAGFRSELERATGVHREARPRGRPRRVAGAIDGSEPCAGDIDR